MEQLVIGLVSGAVGGNIVGGVAKNRSLGTLGNTIAGIVGGGVGAQLLTMLGAANLTDAMGAAANMSPRLDIGSIVGSVGSGGVGGGVIMALVGVVKNMMAK